MRNLACSDAVGRNNNLVLLRFISAIAVIWGHSFAMVDTMQRDPIINLMNGYAYSGDLAVGAFFALSGFLVTRSYWLNPNILEWTKQRLFRIYPAIFVCLTLMISYVFVVYRYTEGPTFFLADDVLDFAITNATLANIVFTLDGAFPHNIRPGVLNGSWWTLPGEIRVYLLFALLAITGIAPHKNSSMPNMRLMIIVVFLALLFVYSFQNFAQIPILMDNLAYASPTQYFLLGSISFYLRKNIPISGRLCIALCALPFFFGGNEKIFLIILMFSTCYSVFYLGYGIKNLRMEDYVGDWSYGIYIYGWFIQQIVASIYPNQTPLVNFLFASVLSILIGWLSWTFVERPALALARRWRP